MNHGTGGVIHSIKISGNFGPKLNGLVRSNRKSFEKRVHLLRWNHFSRSDRLEFWLNGSRPGNSDYTDKISKISCVRCNFVILDISFLGLP